MKKTIPLEDRIIFALDVPAPEEAYRLVDLLGAEINFFKVGLELFLAGCWQVVDHILERGHKVMLDLKFYDIPATVARAVTRVNTRAVSLATIHGNEPIIEAAVGARGPELKLLAVTVLTSFDPSDMKRMGLQGTIEDLVLMRAKKAIELGCDGIVASPQEAARLRQELGPDFIMVTPGIRPSSAQAGDDQRRVATPYSAIKAGADHLVIGRPIRDADDPLEMARSIKDDIERALS